MKFQEKISEGFAEWFRVEPTQKCTQLLKNLSCGHSKKVKTCTRYIVNGFRFHTRDMVETHFEEVQNDETEIEWDSNEKDSDEETDEDSNAASDNDSNEDSDI
ncbi:hypothetical protein M9H77_10967 [Catharanthus roseus]|uniref:Uncharacterized protein n=1 Tax=Catharanthus roseus TaxID=4058 RepID=A0ACC0BD99_CATRO|nr:hypothetical protein M9H77_10967 [Catharanthus roseus]